LQWFRKDDCVYKERSWVYSDNRQEVEVAHKINFSSSHEHLFSFFTTDRNASIVLSIRLIQCNFNWLIIKHIRGYSKVRLAVWECIIDIVGVELKGRIDGSSGDWRW
jgi:hypothetical protein